MCDCGSSPQSRALEVVGHNTFTTSLLELIHSPAPDDIATPDDVANHIAAMEEYRRGETICHDDINWD